jgi:hypothetical protein
MLIGAVGARPILDSDGQEALMQRTDAWQLMDASQIATVATSLCDEDSAQCTDNRQSSAQQQQRQSRQFQSDVPRLVIEPP